jgi:hypothetical protein
VVLRWVRARMAGRGTEPHQPRKQLPGVRAQAARPDTERGRPARSLAVNHPELAAELDPHRNPGSDPTRLGTRSSLKLWWQCAN